MNRFFGVYQLPVVVLFILHYLIFSPITWGEDSSRIAPTFKPLARPKVLSGNVDCANAIDAFWKASLKKSGLTPFPSADKRTLLRRLHFDITGLPPTSDAMKSFLEDNSPDAYEKVVERLLQSPAYGEHWAQQWLDLARYSDSEGFKIDRIRPEAWKYRNWVIRAFNDDLPYDKFVQWQIAGDEIAPTMNDARIATGFLRLAPEESNGADYTQIRQDILNDITDVTAQAFLGLTLGCARCHHHKFDPIKQEEYFEFQAFFSGVLYPDAITLSMPVTMNSRLKFFEEKTKPIRNEISQMMVPYEKALFEEIVVALDLPTQIALKTPKEKRTVTQVQLALLASKQIDRRKNKLYRRLKPEQRIVYDQAIENLVTLEKGKPMVEAYMGVEETFVIPPSTFRLAQGNVHKPKEEVQPDFPDWITTKHPTIRSTKNSSGRRTALAQWLTQPEHPLTSRVIVNRIWQGYFGTALVANPSDFGKASEPFYQPDILDWLATELVERGWSLKSIHRLIVNSSPYKLASKAKDESVLKMGNQIDPGNHQFWRGEVRRLTAEEVRDSILYASGSLNLGLHQGVVRFALPAGLMDSRYSWTPDAQSEATKMRSIYLIQRRNMPNPSLEAFDFPDRNSSCSVRSNTVTALQALALLNDPAMLEYSQHLAANILEKAPSLPSEQITFTFQALLKRNPDLIELKKSLVFLNEKETSNRLEKLTDLVHALVNTSEFLELE